MAENKLVAELRTNFGKGAARKLRAAGKTPAVIYGHGSDPRHITLPAHEIALVLRHKNALIDLDIAGSAQLVLVKSATKDVVTQVIEHILIHFLFLLISEIIVLVLIKISIMIQTLLRINY